MARLKTLAPLVPRLETRTAPPQPKTGDPFYDSREWRAFIAGIIAKRGRRCEDRDCVGPHSAEQAIYGDHVVELQDGGARFDEDNVMLRCARSHGRKTHVERAKRQARPADQP